VCDNRDDDLVRRAVEGDAVALKVLLTSSRTLVCDRISSRIPVELARVIDAEDIVQAAHVEVFRRIGDFELRGPNSFSRWVTAIAVSRLRNAIKQQRAAKRGGRQFAIGPITRRIEDSTIALLDMLAAPGKTPSRCVARREAVDAVHVALADLPESYRRAVWLVHIEGRKAAEAAAQMGRTERAVHGLCRRGRKLLQERLESASRFFSSTG